MKVLLERTVTPKRKQLFCGSKSVLALALPRGSLQPLHVLLLLLLLPAGTLPAPHSLGVTVAALLPISHRLLGCKANRLMRSLARQHLGLGGRAVFSPRMKATH